ncbi:hypothetical protein VXQ32_05715 [Acinetobacter oleivorans]|uniref:hypothetical protein n=1 Tax=Acinetobacter oleivorans TaxID=1148157 RepID=UPI003A87164A
MKNYFFKYTLMLMGIIYIFSALIFIPYIFSNLISFLLGFIEYNNLIFLHIVFFLPLIAATFLFRDNIRKINFNIKNKNKYILFFLILYIFIVSLGLNTYFILKGEWVASDVINIFVLGTYIVAPLVVIWAYIDWKSPKQYELEKEYAEKLLENINEIYFLMLERVVDLNHLKDINEHAVLLNGLIKRQKSYSNTPFYLAHGYLNLLNSMAKKKIDKSLLINFERITQLLDGQSCYIEEKYVIYYEPFSNELKKNVGITCTFYANTVLTKEQLFAKFQIIRYMTEKLESEAIEENGEVILFNLTFKEHIDKFKNEYELLRNEIVIKYIKIDSE